MPSEEEIAHQQKLLGINRRNLAHYLSQQNSLGAAYTPPGVTNGIIESRSNIRRIKGILHNWNVQFEDHPDDEAPIEQASSTQESDAPQQTKGAAVSAFNQPNWNVQNVYNIAGDLHISSNPSKDELLTALRQLRAEFDKARDLPADKADEMKEDLDSAIKAVDKPQPNKERAVERLTTIQKVLESLKGSGESALALGALIGKVILAAQGLHF